MFKLRFRDGEVVEVADLRWHDLADAAVERGKATPSGVGVQYLSGRRARVFQRGRLIAEAEETK